MKKGTVFSLRKIGLYDFLMQYKFQILLCILFCAGFISATFIYSKSDDFSNYISSEFVFLLERRINKKFFYALSYSFVSYFSLLFFIFISGTSLFGIILVPFIVFSIGLIYGGFSSFLYAEHALKGVAFNAVFLVPTIIILSACIFFSAKESLQFSLRMAKLCVQKNTCVNLSAEFKFLCGKYILSVFILILLSLIDAALSVSILNLFNF